MDANLFRSLAESLKQAAAISRGDSKASRVTTLEKKASAPSKTKTRLIAATVGAARTSRVFVSHTTVDARAVREKTGLSQSDFAVVMNVSIKTLQNWEQHRREPTGPAEALLKIVHKEPELALLALHS